MLHDPEIKNLGLFSLKNPASVVKKILILSKKIFKKLKRQKNNKIYPAYLDKSYGLQNADIFFNKDSFKKPFLNHNISTINSIELTSGTYSFNGVIPWENTFKDNEIFESIHRWNWLLLKLINGENRDALANWGKYQIYDWIGKYIKGQKKSLIWGTYTTGERICNLLTFLDKTGLECDEYFKYAIFIMSSHVLNNLEYYGEENTFNHVINNARALYFAGQFLGIEVYSKAARRILQNELPKLITYDGFLREGSSHYQFLFTRWTLEIIYAAQKFKDYEVIQLITPFAQKLISKCWFFLVFDKKESMWSIPLIGDISPDFSPEWLLTLPWSDIALFLYSPPDKFNIPQKRGWTLLFKGIELKPSYVERNCTEHRGPLQVYSSSGWYRFDVGRVTVFLYTEPEGIPKYPGHYHCDTCSFCLYYDGSPVLVDTGRVHYVDDEMSRYAVSARSHNSVQIDGLDPFPEKKYLELWGSACGKPLVTRSKKDEELKIELKHFGFSRLYSDKIQHIRKFGITSSQLTIEDNFFGSKYHCVETFFHWAPELKIALNRNSNRRLRISGNNENYHMECDVSENTVIETKYGDEELPAGWYSPRYGVKIPIWTLIFKSYTTFPARQQFTIILG